MRSKFTYTILTTWILVTQSVPAQEKPVAHWPLTADVMDAAESPVTSQAVDVRFERDPNAQPFAAFNGQSSHVTIPAAEKLRLGTSDFTISMRVKLSDQRDDDIGDLLSQFDPQHRTGFHLSIRNNAGITHSQTNYRQLQFGIDAGTKPRLFDEGRPGNAIFGQSIAVHQGNLYVGTCEAGSKMKGHVYQYRGPNEWLDLGSPDAANSVTSMASYNGQLYAGSGKYRLRGSSLDESENPNLGGRLFRMTPSGTWETVAEFPGMEAVGGLVAFRDKLYVSSLYTPAAFYAFDSSNGKVTALTVPNGKRVEALGVFNGAIYATGYDEGHVYRFDGNEWQDLGQVGEVENTQTYAFATYKNKLQVATWSTGKVFELQNRAWLDRGRLGKELEVMGMMTHNGSLYGGTLPLAQLYRYDGEQNWTLIQQLDTTPDVKYRRIWTMAQYQGRLFITTLPSGNVWSMQAGALTTWDHEFPSGWHHIAAQREGHVLRLFVDGKKVAESGFDERAEYNLNTDQPWQIGAGTGDSFHGGMSDLKIYKKALTISEILQLARSNR